MDINSDGSGKGFNAVTNPEGKREVSRSPAPDFNRQQNPQTAKQEMPNSSPAMRPVVEEVTPGAGEQKSGFVGVGSLSNGQKPFKLGGG
jgi:hypothetical protein